MEIIINIDKEQYKFIKQSMTMYKVKDYYALLFDICERIANGIPIPDNATNGEVIDLIFPYEKPLT